MAKRKNREPHIVWRTQGDGEIPVFSPSFEKAVARMSQHVEGSLAGLLTDAVGAIGGDPDPEEKVQSKSRRSRGHHPSKMADGTIRVNDSGARWEVKTENQRLLVDGVDVTDLVNQRREPHLGGYRDQARPVLPAVSQVQTTWFSRLLRRFVFWLETD